MSELREEELLEVMSEAFGALHYRVDTGALDSKDAEAMVKAEDRKVYYKQAHLQIREMIQKPEELPKKRALKIDEIISKYPEAVRIVLGEFAQKLDALQQIKKPTVTKAFVEKWNQIIAEKVNVLMKKDFIRQEISLVYPGTENLTQMLKEAGVEIVGEKRR